MTYTYR